MDHGEPGVDPTRGGRSDWILRKNTGMVKKRRFVEEFFRETEVFLRADVFLIDVFNGSFRYIWNHTDMLWMFEMDLLHGWFVESSGMASIRVISS